MSQQSTEPSSSPTSSLLSSKSSFFPAATTKTMIFPICWTLCFLSFSTLGCRVQRTEAAFISTFHTSPFVSSSSSSSSWRHRQQQQQRKISPSLQKSQSLSSPRPSNYKMSLDFNTDITKTNKKKKVIYTPTTVSKKKNLDGDGDDDPLEKKQKEEDSTKTTNPNLNILLIDNYDSYTYNLYQYLSTINFNSTSSSSTTKKEAKPPLVVANDAYASWEELRTHVTRDYFDGEDIDCIIISPGPGRPECGNDMGICLQAIEQNPDIPILGVCLGHQALGYYYNASIILSPDGPIHGQLSGVCYDEKDVDSNQQKKKRKKEVKCNLFQGIPQNFDVVRYHSLAVQFPDSKEEEEEELSIEPIAWCDTLPPLNKYTDKVCMALQHKYNPHYGVQFHPESIGTGENGYKILDNFCNFVKEYWKSHDDRRPKKKDSSVDVQKFLSKSASTATVATESTTTTTTTATTAKVNGDVNRQTKSRYNVLIHKIPTDKTTSVIPEQVYEAFFFNTTNSNSFWLDSSTGCLPSNFISPDNECAIQSNSRFSIMGGNDGPLSRRVEYYGKDFPTENRGLRIISGSNEDAVEENVAEGDILSYLRQRIVNKDEIVDYVDLITFEKDSVDAGEKAEVNRVQEVPQGTMQSPSATSSLPFEYRGGYVGFLGYEVRHDTRRYIIEQEQQRGGEAQVAENKHPNGKEANRSETIDKDKFVAKNNKNIPTAAFLFADRSVLYDHWMDEWYLVGVSSDEEYFSQTNDEEAGREVFVEKNDVISWMKEMSANISKLSSASSSSLIDDEVVNGRETNENITSPHNNAAATKRPKEERIHFIPNRSKQQYQADITRCHKEIKNGESYELCVTNQLETVIRIPSSLSSPSPYFPLTEVEQVEKNSSDRQPEEGENSGRHVQTHAETSDVGKTPFGLYKILRKRNPAPFAAFFKLDGSMEGEKNKKQKRKENTLTANVSICCSSPERFLSVTKVPTFSGSDRGHPQSWYHDYDASSSLLPSAKHYQVESKPIKGTAARHFMTKEKQYDDGTTASTKSSALSREENNAEKEDQKIADDLRTSIKNRAENLMIVDLLRNDLSRVCKIGSVHVPRLMHIESFATVHQMVSTIRGLLESNEKDPKNAIDLMSACFPGGSMTGAPKLRTMDILDEMEGGVSRGPYSGSLGYISLNGCMDMNIVIRTAVLTPYQDPKKAGNDLIDEEKNDGSVCWQASIGAGGAITALSESDDEYEEMLLKARAVKNAVQTWVDRIDSSPHSS